MELLAKHILLRKESSKVPSSGPEERPGRGHTARTGDFRNEPGYYLILKLSWRLFFCKENDTARTCVPGHTPQWRGGGRFPWCCRALRGCGADKHAVGLLSKGICSSAGGRRLLLLLFAMPRNKSRPYTRSASFFFFFSELYSFPHLSLLFNFETGCH